MTRTVVIKGRKVGPQTVELDEPLPEQASEIEVLAHVKTEGGRKLSEIIASFPPGKRSKEDIDRQIREDRDAW
jgi:hypothetical protein